MRTESRRYVRRQVYIRAKLLAGRDVAPLDCAIVDISEGGARLNIDAAQELPQEFTLVLGRHGCPYRRCRIVWRKETQMGVVFDRTLSSKFFEAEILPIVEREGELGESQPGELAE
jgi:PilZ domain